MAIAVFVCGFEHFAPPHSECIFRCFELPFFLFQTSCGGDESFPKVFILRRCVRREVAWTIVFAGPGLIIRLVLFGRLLVYAFVVRWFALLYCWVIRSAVVVEAGLSAASASPFWLFVGGIILCRAPLVLVIASFWGIDRVYVV